MDILEIIRLWLEKQGVCPRLDSCAPEEGRSGLYPLGRQAVRVREDVLGTVHETARYSYLLRIPAVPGEAAEALLCRLQLEAATAPPQLGDRSRFAVHNGKMTKPAGDGLAWYEVRLDAEREEEYA